MKETRFAKLHPALTFAFFMIAIVLSALVQHPAYVLVSAAAAVCLNVTLSGGKALKSFLRLIPLWVILSAVNPILNPLGETVLFRYGGRPYTLEALCYGMVLSGMFVAMLEWFAAYNAVMTEDKFSYLFSALAPSLAMLLTTVLRMVPGFIRKAGQIGAARRSIGMGEEKLRGGMSVLSALMTWALEGSIVTSDSMTARGYGTGRRSCYHSYRFKAEDAAWGGILSVLLIVTIIALARGGGMAEYTPKMQAARENGWGIIAEALFLFAPAALNLKEEVQWSILRSKI